MMADGKILLVNEGAYWTQVQDIVQNAVIQIFAQVNHFNWLEPYQNGEQAENRGSGFFIDDQGHIVTTAHVILEAKHVWIQVPILGQQLLHADIVSICPERDIALLKLHEKDAQHIRTSLTSIPYLMLGDSDTVKRTDSVLVLGYPLGQYRLKSATGVVSGREFVQGHSLIQITAPVNPGNSGGPLLNVQGQVIGITIAMVPYAYNLGYAIPINELHMVLKDLFSIPLVRRPTLGARFSFGSDEQAYYLRNPVPSGLYICTVFKNSLFERGGIKSGDVIYAVNDFQIDAFGDAFVPWTTDKTSLFDLISRFKIGDTLFMIIYRAGERKEINLKFDIPTINPIRFKYPDFEKIDFEVLGGLVIMELADNHLAYLLESAQNLLLYTRPENKVEPVLVITHVMPGSYAYRLRTLMPGMIIKQANGIDVRTIEDLRKALRTNTTQFMTLKTDYDVLAVFALDRLIADEDRLSKDFVYPISDIVREWQKRIPSKDRNDKKTKKTS